MTDMTPLFSRLTVTALEDLHTGTGTGQGDIDALIIRDRNGYPVIRASHFTGLLRQAGEELIKRSTLNKEELAALLGKEGNQKGALRMTSLYTERENCTLVWGSSMRTPGKRQPETDTLRYIEHVAAGTRFEATLRLPCEYLPLLERLLRRIDRIGGSRNRGSGLVTLDWQSIDVNKELPWKKQAAMTQATSGNGQPRLRLMLRNLEPLCLPATGHPGNLIRSQSFIRGQALRGAFIVWALLQGKTAPENVSFGDALPLLGNCAAETLLPIPLSILTPKPEGSSSKLPWWAAGGTSDEAFDSLGGMLDPDEKAKRPGTHEYLCRLEQNSEWLHYAPILNVRLRNQSADDSTQKTELFSLEEIAEETCFQVELRFNTAEATEEFKKTFSTLLHSKDWLTIGRGGQPVVVDAFWPVEATDQLKEDFEAKDNWTLTLTSDAIVRGRHLGFLDNLDILTLCEQAGIKSHQDWIIEKCTTETDAIYGFNAASGLHRAAALAIRRGSCWLIKGQNSHMLADILTNKDKAALGERTCEGFGRFVIDVQPIKALRKPQQNTKKPSANPQEALLAAAKALADLPGANQPSASQLQWLRNRALACETDDQLGALLKEIRGASGNRPNSGKVWEPFKVDKQLGKQLDQAFKNMQLIEKRLLISHFVQYVLQKEPTGQRAIGPEANYHA